MDRNVAIDSARLVNGGSLSARRAWIEIRRFLASRSAVLTSLSARRAWIEIDEQIEQEPTPEGRSPQGERG